MTTSAFVTMILSWSVIAFYTIRFFVKVLRTPPHPDSNSYSDNQKKD